MNKTIEGRPAVTGTVLFTISVRVIPAGEGHWVAICRQSGMVSHGATEQEALDRNGEMHQLAVRRVKESGPVALANFMDHLGIEFEIQPDGGAIRPMQATPGAGTNREVEAAA